MKRILALVILAVLFSANAFAATVTGTFGDQDSAKNYRIQADNTGLVTFAQDTSIAYPYENISAPSSQTYTLSSTDSGSSITDFGQLAATHTNVGSSSNGNKYVLPLCTSSTLGYWYHIATAVKETITVTPTSTADTIAYSISGTAVSAGVGIKNTSAQAADGITIACVSAGVWSASDATGVFATAP